jgi:uracil phosphoribosyltransferase
LVNDWVGELRNVAVQEDRMRFRHNLERIGSVAAYEISKKLPYVPVTVQTPMGMAIVNNLEAQPVVATIMRAGLPLYQGILNFFDKADSAFIGAYRKHRKDDSFEIDQTYVTSPELVSRPLIVADPMLATGSSLILALDALVAYDSPSEIHIVSVIACTVGIEAIQRKYPQCTLWIAAIDEELTAKGYIVPGLGDAGDLAFGSKRQS